LKHIVSEKYVIADADEATSYRGLDEVVRDFEQLGDTVVFDKRENIVAVITTSTKQDAIFKALVIYFEKLTIGTRRLDVRYDRYVLANVDEETNYKDLDEVRANETHDMLNNANREDLVIVLKTLSGIRTALVYSIDECNA
jgi:fructose-1,6-bisphosphatase/sedoheptulose 1,7-bisphosphatase-like protein